MRARKSESGQVLPLVAICLAVLIGFAGLAIDVGYEEYEQRQQQSAADAAAIGGAQQLVYSGCPNSSAATTAAQNDAASNGFTNGSGSVSVVVNNPPASGPFTSLTCAVQVTINATHAPFFSTLFGFRGRVSTQAVAALSGNDSGCMYMLSHTVSVNFNGARVTAPGCGLLLNDTANFNGATIDIGSIGYAGSKPNENGATFSKGTPQKMLPVADPCPEIFGCAYLTDNPPPISGCQNFNGNGYRGALTAGCYNNLNLNGATVTLSGTYILNGTDNFNGATITGTNVTIYVTASGTAPNFNGASVTLSAPTSGNYANVLYYQVPSNTQSPNFNGSVNRVTGLLYAPSATSVNFNGAGGGYAVLVFGSANYNGSNATVLASPPPGGSLIKQAVLAQ